MPGKKFYKILAACLRGIVDLAKLLVPRSERCLNSMQYQKEKRPSHLRRCLSLSSIADLFEKPVEKKDATAREAWPADVVNEGDPSNLLVVGEHPNLCSI